MSLLSVVQTIAEELGLGTPGSVAATSDPQIKQLRRLLNRAGKVLAARTTWQALVKEATFTTVATAIQTAVTDIDPALHFIVNDTIFNRDLRRPIFGPLSLTQYQVQKALVQTGPFNQYVIQGGNIIFIPVPVAGQTCAFQYVTKAWVYGGGQEYSSDTDVALLSEELLQLELIWRWRKAKGLPWQTDYEEAETRILEAMGRDGVKPVLDAVGNLYPYSPYIVVPVGSWPVVSV